MKKTIITALCLATSVALMGSVSLAGAVTAPGTTDTTVTYTVLPTYTITIPDTLKLGAAATELSVEASNMVIESGKAVTVTAPADVSLVNGGSTLTSTISGGPLSFTANDATKKFSFSAPTGTATVAGDHTGTATFTIAYETVTP